MPFELPPWSILAALFVVGAVVGRWLNLCIERVPYYERLGDQFRVAGDRITRIDAVAAGLPIVGPLTASGSRVFGRRGRGARAALVELLNGVLLALLYACEVPPVAEAGPLASSTVITIGRDAVWPFVAPEGFVALQHARFLLHAVLVEALLVATFVDFDLRIIPSGATDPFTVLGVLAAWAVGPLHLAPLWIQDQSLLASFSLEPVDPIRRLSMGPEVPAWIAAHPHWHGLAAAVAGVVVGGGIVFVVRIVGGWALGREAMGQGDAYLMMTIGAFLGWQAVGVVFFLAPLFALLAHAVLWIVDPDGEIPYGPYLSLAAVAVLLTWQNVFAALQNVFALGVLLPILAAAMTASLAVCLLLTRGLKWLLGLRVDWDEEDETEPARSTSIAGGTASGASLRSRTWPGADAARGTRHAQIWRRGSR